MIPPTPLTPQGFRPEIPPFRSRGEGEAPWATTGWRIRITRGADGLAVHLDELQWRREPDRLVRTASGLYRSAHGDLSQRERVLGGLQIVRTDCEHEICGLTVALVAVAQAVVPYDECLESMTLDSEQCDLGDRAELVMDMDPLF